VEGVNEFKQMFKEKTRTPHLWRPRRCKALWEGKKKRKQDGGECSCCEGEEGARDRHGGLKCGEMNGLDGDAIIKRNALCASSSRRRALLLLLLLLLRAEHFFWHSLKKMSFNTTSEIQLHLSKLQKNPPFSSISHSTPNQPRRAAANSVHAKCVEQEQQRKLGGHRQLHGRIGSKDAAAVVAQAEDKR
jgi:hypothetical protein